MTANNVGVNVHGGVTSPQGYDVGEGRGYGKPVDYPPPSSLALSNENMLTLLLFASIPTVLSICLFSSMGYGLDVYNNLDEAHDKCQITLMAAAGTMFVMHILDFSYWTGPWIFWKQLGLGFVAGSSCIGVLLLTLHYPVAPLALFLGANGPIFYLVRKRMFPLLHISVFLSALAKCLLLLGAVVAVVWGVHLNSSHEWWGASENSVDVKPRLLAGLQCPDIIASLNLTETPARMLSSDSAITDIASAVGGAAGVLSYAASSAGRSLVEIGQNSSSSSNSNSNSNNSSSSNNSNSSNSGGNSSKNSGVGTGSGTGNGGTGVLMKSEPTDDNDICGGAAFLLWITPLITSLVLAVFGALCYYLARSIRKADSRLVALRVFGAVLMTLLCALWVAASTAGARMHMSNAVTSLSMVGLVMLSYFVGCTIGWQQLQVQTSLTAVPLVRTIVSSVYSDWCKAMFIMMCWPIMVLYFATSIVNQFCRRHFSAGKRFDDAAEARMWMTKAAADQWEQMRQWQWTSVLVKCQYVGIGLVSCSVGIGIMVTLFLSWLNSALESFGLWTISVIFVGVGLTMFLLPPVPGVPVYISSGIIITKAAQKYGMDTMTSLIYASILSFFIKIPLAFTMQQKFIGEQMSDNLWIKKNVGVNSLTIKAIEHILRQKGMTMGKMCILCGGPDWPTSVLCGILKLNLCEMLIGSIPVLALTAPCSFAGGFLVLPDPKWEAISSVTIAVSAVIQTIAMLAAMYFIEDVVSTQRAYLESKPRDPDVDAAEQQDRQNAELYVRATDWHARQKISDWNNGKRQKTEEGEVQIPPMATGPPQWVRLVLLIGAALNTASVYAMQLFAARCFKEFSVKDDLSMLGDTVLNIVLPEGWLAIELFFVSTLSLVIFSHWSSGAVKCLRGEEEAAMLSLPQGQGRRASHFADGYADTVGSMARRASVGQWLPLHQDESFPPALQLAQAQGASAAVVGSRSSSSRTRAYARGQGHVHAHAHAHGARLGSIQEFEQVEGGRMAPQQFTPGAVPRARVQLYPHAHAHAPPNAHDDAMTAQAARAAAGSSPIAMRDLERSMRGTDTHGSGRSFQRNGHEYGNGSAETPLEEQQRVISKSKPSSFYSSGNSKSSSTGTVVQQNPSALLWLYFWAAQLLLSFWKVVTEKMMSLPAIAANPAAPAQAPASGSKRRHRKKGRGRGNLKPADGSRPAVTPIDRSGIGRRIGEVD